MKRNYLKVLGIPDLQVPYHDQRSLAAVEKVMGGEAWDYIIQYGDFMDHDCISHHNAGLWGKVEGKTLEGDYEKGNAILDRWQRLARKSQLVILEGNHDFRPQKLVDAQPQLRGRVETKQGLHLKQRGILWVPFWSKGTVFKLGKTTHIHGLYTNDFHAKKHTIRYGDNIFYGHTHDVQQYSHVLHGDNKTITGQSLGCLCRYDQEWMQGKPQNWQQAFVTFTIRPNGFFNHNVVRIFNHHFIYEGKEIKG